MASKNPNINLAVKALRNASRLLLRDFLEVRFLRASIKGTQIFSSRAAKRAEKSIVEELRTYRPHYGYKCQTIDDEIGSDPTRNWVISGVDGFNNYSLGLPHWVMTIALVHKGKTNLAVIYNPLENELFTAEKGIGSWLNNTRIRTSKKNRLSEFSIGTEIMTIDQRQNSDLKRFQNVTEAVATVRVMGSASLDLVNVSCGRLEGYWTPIQTPTELPAGALMVIEAGGFVEPVATSESTQNGLIAAGSDGFSILAKLIRNH